MRADFDSALFAGNVAFRDAQFLKDTGFGETEFGGDADFRLAEFMQRPVFWGADFEGHRHFEGATMGGEPFDPAKSKARKIT